MSRKQGKFAAAVSQHPEAAVAVAEVVGQSLDQTGHGPELALLFASGTHRSQISQIAQTIHNTLGPTVLLGCSAGSTLVHHQEIEEGPSVVLWTARISSVEPLRLLEPKLPENLAAGSAVVLMADPFSFDAAAFAATICPTITLVGGLASAASHAGGNQLLLDDMQFTDGAVAVVLPPGIGAQALVATGCRPVGDPMVITKAEGSLIRHLAGRPAIERLGNLLDSADTETATRIRRGLHLGIVIDEHQVNFEAGDFLIRPIVGADQSSGALAVGAPLPVGTTVQFQVRDAEAASADLESRLSGLSAAAAVAFTCNGRGSNLFGVAGHDAEHLVDGLGTTAVVGMSCAGELGPVGSEHHLHGFTNSVLLIGTVAE
ncbi:MAG: FIST N-terminal domain-containing protein [Acidimicrobiales bacterium]|nr:FIST N-terminal domain-containing protein [Acidimicrobiales bacterium]